MTGVAQGLLGTQIDLLGPGPVALVLDLLDIASGVEDPERAQRCDVLHP